MRRRARTPLGEAPAFALAVSCLVFILARADMGIHAAPAALLALIASAGWICLGTVYPAKSSMPVAILLFVSSIFGIICIDARIAREEIYPKSVEATGVVLSERRMGFTQTAVVRVKSRKLSGGSKFVLKYDGELRPGDVVRFAGEVEKFQRAVEPRKFDEFLFWRARGALFSVRTWKIEVIGREFGVPYIRYMLDERIKTMLPRRTAGYIAAAWLGERDHDLTEFHRNAGTSHILAVSGLHIMMAYAVCWFLLRRLKYRLYVISVVIWSYALLSGAAPSALRAALMLQFVLVGKLLGESGGSFNGACVASCVMMMWNPWIFWDIGWRMSVLSVMALTSLYSLDIENGAKYFISSPLMWMASSMLAAWTFGFVPLAGLLINFFAVPFFGILLPAASLLSLPALNGVWGGKYFAAPAEICFVMWERFSNNITYLIPWKTNFSYPMVAGGVLIMTYMFARACGFPGSRAYYATGAGAVLMAYIVLSATPLFQF